MEIGFQFEQSLPAPQEEEPSSLRSDIYDEISDHLNCSLRHELLKNHDFAAAQVKVLARFGDPARVALQLWWQAMKVRIMLQKTIFITCVLLSLGSVAAAFYLVQQSQNNYERLLTSHEKSQATLIEQLKSIEKQQSRTLDWNPLKLTMKWNREGNPPAEGIYASLYVRNEQNAYDAEKSGPDGVIDFGLLSPGVYQVLITSPGGRTNRRITVRPGVDQNLTFICPDAQPLFEAKVSLNTPEALRDQVFAVAYLTSPPIESGEDQWSGSATLDQVSPMSYSLFTSEKLGTHLCYPRASGFRSFGAQNLTEGEYMELLESSQLYQGRYQLQQLTIYRSVAGIQAFERNLGSSGATNKSMPGLMLLSLDHTSPELESFKDPIMLQKKTHEWKLELSEKTWKLIEETNTKMTERLNQLSQQSNSRRGGFGLPPRRGSESPMPNLEETTPENDPTEDPKTGTPKSDSGEGQPQPSESASPEVKL